MLVNEYPTSKSFLHCLGNPPLNGRWLPDAFMIRLSTFAIVAYRTHVLADSWQRIGTTFSASLVPSDLWACHTWLIEILAAGEETLVTCRAREYSLYPSQGSSH